MDQVVLLCVDGSEDSIAAAPSSLSAKVVIWAERPMAYILPMIACPNPEQDVRVAPSIRRWKS